MVRPDVYSIFLLRPTLQVQENLAQSLQHMSDLLLSKAKLFDPPASEC